MRQITFALVVAAIVLAGCSSETATQKASSEKPSPTESKEHFAKLDITEFKQVSGSAQVAGTTDLPDGAKLSVDVHSAKTGLSAEAVVTDGKWAAKVLFPQVRDFEVEPHKAEVLFTPMGQDPDVLARVGAHGEHLTGELVSDSGMGFNVMTATKEIDVKLRGLTSSIPSPAEYKHSDPRQVVAQMLQAWNAQDWAAMGDITVLGDPSEAAERVEIVKNNLDFRKLRSAKFKKVDNRETVAYIDLEVTAEMGPQSQTDVMKLKVMRADDQGFPRAGLPWRIHARTIT